MIEGYNRYVAQTADSGTRECITQIHKQWGKDEMVKVTSDHLNHILTAYWFAF